MNSNDALGGNEAEIGAWFHSLPSTWTDGCEVQAIVAARAAYASPGRCYHTWSHAAACVDVLTSFPCGAPKLVFLALVFHDAIYIPGRGDNEQRSADLARMTLRAMTAIGDRELDSIERMILATRDHRGLAKTLSADELPILDIDLSILGAPHDAYAGYARAIRDEYTPAVTSEAKYRIGRRDFLQSMLASPQIYLTSEGRARWEATARENLAWEDASLANEQSIAERAISAIRNL